MQYTDNFRLSTKRCECQILSRNQLLVLEYEIHHRIRGAKRRYYGIFTRDAR